MACVPWPFHLWQAILDRSFIWPQAEKHKQTKPATQHPALSGRLKAGAKIASWSEGGPGSHDTAGG